MKIYGNVFYINPVQNISANNVNSNLIIQSYILI